MSPRLDAELVRGGLARSRAQAAQLVKDGSVRLGGVTVLRVSTPVPDDAVLEVVAAAVVATAEAGTSVSRLISMRSHGSAEGRSGTSSRLLSGR